MTERAQRIMSAYDDKWVHLDKKYVVAHVIRAVARDFPQFRTAEKPNDWEKGYHTVIETLHDIANEIERL
jgi:hypothetical protein